MTTLATLASDTPDLYIILPDGRLEPAAGRIPVDVPIEGIVFPRVSPLDAVQARYQAMRLAGESHNIADMLANRAFPGAKTDSIFNEGKFSGESNQGCAPKELWLRKEAERRGFSTNGKWYCGGLADYPGDPTAWVSGRGDVERVAREKNFNVDGYVTHKAHEVEFAPDIDIDPRLVHAEAADIVESMPGVKYEDAYEKVHALRTGKVDPNPLRVSEPTQDW